MKTHPIRCACRLHVVSRAVQLEESGRRCRNLVLAYVLVSTVEDCAARCIDILGDPDLGRDLGRRGKEHVRQHFLTPRYLRDYLRIFSEVLDG